jgi:hypothetical protein
MKRLTVKFLGAMLLTILAAGFAIPARAQESEDAALAEKAQKVREKRAASVKSVIQYHAKHKNNDRAELVPVDKSKVVGRITEIHESDFVVTDKKTKSSQTIAYDNVAQGPLFKKPEAEVILGDTALAIFLIPLLPLVLPFYLIFLAAGGAD